MILKMTEFLRENRPDFDAAREKAKAYDQAAWEAKINEVYGASASSIIALEHEYQKNLSLIHILAGAVGGLILTVIGVTCSQAVLVRLHTPANIIPDAVLYVRIYFLAAIPMVLYNMRCV